MIVFVAKTKGHTSLVPTLTPAKRIVTGDGFKALGVLNSNGIVSTELWNKGCPSYLNAMKTALTNR